MTRPTVDGHRPDGQRALFLTLASAVSTFSLLQSLIIPALGTIAREFGTDQTATSWVLTAYLLSAAVWTPTLGRLGDTFGRRVVLLGALSAVLAGLLIAAFTSSLAWLIVARIIQGAGGGVVPLSLGIIRTEFRGRQTTAMGALAAFTSFAFGVGLVIAGPLIGLAGFASLFLVPAVGISVVLALAWRFVPRSGRGAGANVPVVPALLLSAGLVGTLLAVSCANDWGWSSANFLGVAIAGVLTLTTWAIIERRATNPFIDLGVVGARALLPTNAITLLAGFCTFSAFGFIPQYLQASSTHGYGFGISMTESGLILVPFTVASFWAGITVGWVARRSGFRPLLLAGALITATAFLAMVIWHEHLWQFALLTAVQGYGSGLLISGTATHVALSAPTASSATASGVNANLRTIGGAVGATVTATILAVTADADGVAAGGGYLVAFGTFGGAMLVAALLALAVPRRTKEPQPRFDGDTSAGALAIGPDVEGRIASDPIQ